MPNNRRGRGREAPRAPLAGGVFIRLRIPCPKMLTSDSLMTHCSSKIPITFRGLPSYMTDICYKMDQIKMRSDSSSDSDYEDEWDPVNNTNKAILIKGALVLAELKVFIANNQQLDFYSHDRLHNLYDMAILLPKPLVEYLDCIGTVREDGRGYGAGKVTPVLAEGPGAPALAPSQLAPLLARLHRGVPAAAGAEERAALDALPLTWERHGDELRLSDDSFRSWVDVSGPADAPRYAIRWTDEDSRRFSQIISSVRDCKDGRNYIVDVRHLSDGMGSPAQFVQTSERYSRCKWFTMTDIDDEHIRKGVNFGFGSVDCRQEQPSRFTGTLETSYRSGDADFRRFHVNEGLGKLANGPQFGTIIPVTFSALPQYIEYIWNVSIGSNDSAKAKAAFTKAALMLAEAKVYFAQMASKHTTLHPGQMVIYSSEEVDLLKRMPKWLPKPLAVYLECVGVTSAGARRQEATPVLLEQRSDLGGWTDDDSRLFQATIRSMRATEVVYTDLTHGQGSPAQFVQFASTRDNFNWWYTMTEIDEVSMKLGAAFRFSDFAGRGVPPSRFTGTLDTALQSGYLSECPDTAIFAALTVSSYS